MRKIPVIVGSTLLMFLSSCSEENLLLPSEEQTVVEAYLYANQSTQSLDLSASYPIDTAARSNAPISDAVVTVLKNGASYRFTLAADVPGRYRYTGSNLKVQAGDAFSLRVERAGAVITSSTTVPPPPSSVRISADTMKFTEETITTPFGSRILLRSSGELTVCWVNTSQNYYYMTVEPIDPGRQPLQLDSIPRVFQFVSRPSLGDSARISDAQISYTGRHRVRIYRVNKEYADLFLSREQDSRQLNEPLTNIDNGLGIFTAVNSDSVFFTVVRK
ncbi:DUF4249 family protein [bacterium]|nr:MAG: DUF4249 family protein [bacterium]